MNAKALMTTAATLGAAAALIPGTAFANTGSGKLDIHHQVRGCHSWSLNGGPYRANQIVKLARGGSLLITNNDLMVQDLTKTSGPAVAMKLVSQSHMGSTHM